MIHPEELKVGLLVWWRGDRTMSEWDCPGVITLVDRGRNKFRVKTFDTMEESGELSIMRPPHHDESSLTEMNITTPEEVLKYVSSKEQKYASSVAEAESDLAEFKTKVALYSKKAETLRKEIAERFPESEGILPKQENS